MSEVEVAPARLHTRTIAVANQKGGVGKTTTAINLGTAMAAVGKRVLVVDFDPQGNASTGLGVARKDRKRSIYDVILGDVTLAEATRASAIPGLDLVPSTVDLSGAELELIEVERRNFRLADALATAEVKYDYVIIDCPPGINLLTVNALVAADAVIVPVQCEFFALEGLSLLLRTVERIRRSFNPDLRIHGILLTMFDRRNSLSDQVAADVRDFLGDQVYDTVIPRNVRVSEAPSYGKPVLLYDHRCAGSHAYMRLARELLRREEVRDAA